MTSRGAWNVARRALGVFFVVEGLVVATGAIAMIGIVVPEGSRTTGYVSAALLQGAIQVVAGVLLLTNASLPADEESTADVGAFTRGALQVLGVYLLVKGAAAFANFLMGVSLVEAGLAFRTSQVGSAAVELAAGLLLIAKPQEIISRIR
jgi:hypothetical protein